MRDLFTSFKDNCGFGVLASIDSKATHKNLKDAVTALSRMIHRGAVAADGKSADGSGLLLSIPKEFFDAELKSANVEFDNDYAVAMVFSEGKDDIDTFREVCAKNGLEVIYVRDVPVDTDHLGEQALKTLPEIKQIFVTPANKEAASRFEALVYLSRREIEKQMSSCEDFYIASFSNHTISYKGLVMPTHIEEFYCDLQDEKFKISYALFHQRFSTNTLPKWSLAQPFRMIAHNGEINSIEANRFDVGIKMSSVKSTVYSDDEMKSIRDLIQPEMSDSASLDNFFEFLTVNGMDFFRAARSVIPAPWHNAPHMDPELKAFYEYNSTRFEPWDGPAAVSMTDGRYIGCLIDRNGLRPAKYVITTDNRLLIASEYGVLEIPDEEIVERGRLQSGQMIAVDLEKHEVLKSDEIDNYLKTAAPYGKWLNNDMTYLQEHTSDVEVSNKVGKRKDMQAKQRYFNYTLELIREVIKPMVLEGKETTAAMGDDTPLAAFSQQQRPFTDFFKQKFSQVTNPPMDSIRERMVMSLNTGFGEIGNILADGPEHARRLKTVSPIMSAEKLQLLIEFGTESNSRYSADYKVGQYNTTFSSDIQSSMKSLVESIINDVKKNGIRTIILDDREVDDGAKALPMLMVVGHLNQSLQEQNLRQLTSIVAVTGEVFDPHTAMCMISFGATTIFPYLLYYTIEDIVRDENPDADMKVALKKSRRALSAGLYKIMSKMGISVLSSYRNSSLFDIIGLGNEIVDECFSDARALLGGLGYSDIESRLNTYHAKAYSNELDGKRHPLYKGGFYKYKKGEEFHDFSRDTILAIQRSAITGDKDEYEILKNLVDNRDKKFIRDFFDIKSDKKPISIDDVEPLSEIFKRFSTAAMSMGSISPEVHTTLAIAMNQIGGKSNSGEGGEDPARYNTDMNSEIKQVASGRFGVTPEYLRSASELQIKVAQGAKPGEGGQLPGSKVTPLIATLRYTKPGVTLISPPPHHDIYSIEDLAQLIFDLKQINPNAKIAVKLVSTSGVGTIAAGVAKCYADKIIISGADGGTGAAPIGSIRFAGNPWELGLVEAHNALKANNLRDKVVLETDGGLKSGLDVVKAAMFGAEEYAFGTGALVTVGCMMFRVCHLNTCAVGVATQKEELRAKYKGSVDRVVNYFTLLAEDVREILASMGYSSLKDIVGRVDLLQKLEDEFCNKFDFDSLLYRLDGPDSCQVESNEPFDSNKYEKDIAAQVSAAIDNKTPIEIEQNICNTNRSFGTYISGLIAEKYGNDGLPDKTIKINLRGVTGQSLGAFLVNGVHIHVDGAGNDYIGKGMNGGEIVIVSSKQKQGFSLGGNTCLYGATGGKLYIAGEVGERFAVRNSGATTVVEGTGDHPCEYMTGGTVVILGETGTNFGAGMTGGVAFVYDENRTFFEKVNRELVDIVRIDTDEHDTELYDLQDILKDYLKHTNSLKAQAILENFRYASSNFWMVSPKGDTYTMITRKRGE